MIIEGLMLMLYGMGIVFTFLVVMIFVVNAMSAIVQQYNKKHPEKTDAPAKKPAAKAVSDDTEIAIAIAMAHAQAK